MPSNLYVSSRSADKEVVLSAMMQIEKALTYASDDMKADKELVLSAVRKNGSLLLHASKDLKADKEVVLAAVTSYSPDCPLPPVQLV